MALAPKPLDRHDRLALMVKQFLGDTLYSAFEHMIMLILTLVIVVVILFATWDLVSSFYKFVIHGGDESANHIGYPDIFAMFFTVLIGLEFKRSFLIVSSTHTSIVRIRSIILIGLLATLRKFIVLDLKEINVLETLAVAAAILSLGIVYWLVRDQETRAWSSGQTDTD